MNWELTWILCSTALPEIKSKSKLISEIYIYSFSEGHCKDIRSTSIDISGKKIITRIRSRNKEQSLWMCKVMQNTKLFVHLKISLVNGTKFTDTTKFFYGFFSFCVNVFYFCKFYWPWSFCRSSQCQPDKIPSKLSKKALDYLSSVLKVDNKVNIMTSLKTLPHIGDGDFWENFVGISLTSYGFKSKYFGFVKAA